MSEPEKEQERALHRLPEGEVAAAKQRGGVLRRLWRRLVHACRWLCAPNALGRPVTLRPRSVRLLLLLALGHLLLLLLLGAALYRASTMPDLARPVSSQALPTAASESTATPGPTPTALGSGGAIAFSLRRDGNTDLYALNQETRQLVRLTHHPAEDRSPAWSPDGDYLAFASNRADNWDIYLLDLVSGALIRLTHHASFDAHPSWSPDGAWLAFETYRDGNLDIYRMSTTGKQLHAVTTDPAADFAPAWAPDGEALAFTSWRDGSKDIFLRLLREDYPLVNITQSPDLDEDKPAWSADGSRLAYVSGPEGQTSVQVAAFDWETLSTDQTETEFFGTGDAPAWAPDGESLVYVHTRSGGEGHLRSHLVAASMAGWALFHEVYSTEGLLDGIMWTDAPLSPRVVARAQEANAGGAGGQLSSSLYAEVVQPTPAEGVPTELIALPGVRVAELMAEPPEEGAPRLSDRVNDSFNALRRRVIEETGWDYLSELDSAWLPLSYTPPSGHSRRSWHLCGRAFALNQEPYEASSTPEEGPQIALVREDIGTATYWRVFLRAAVQDGSMGEPLRVLPWDLHARDEGGRAEVDGGVPMERIPPGYYVDFTALARDYGWERVPSLWRWRHFWPDILWWEYRKTGDLTWWSCMLEVFAPEEIEAAFGPIPGPEG
jgi:TolB protein